MNKTYPLSDSITHPTTNPNIEQNTDETNALQINTGELQTNSASHPENQAIPGISPSKSASPKPFYWLLLWFLFSCSLGGLTAFAFLWLTALPPAADCDEISSLSPDMERLHCAQEAAQSGELSELIAGLELVETWTPDHPLYNEANRWMAEWSTSVLRIARQRMGQNDMDGAIELAKRIPASSPVYPEAQATIAQWQERWQQGEVIYNQAQEALKQEDWDLAYAKIFELRDHPYSYWNAERANALSAQVQTEKQARRILAEANSIAQLENPQQLVTAIERLKQIDRNTHTWTAAQSTLTQWGEALLVTGEQRWQAKQFSEAIAFAESAKLSEELAPDADNLIKLSQARQLAIRSSSSWKVTPKHVWSMMEAVSAARQISPDSRFHAQAQASLESWDAQLQDMLQLQYAQVAASLGNREAVESAIAQAEQIDFNRPRRLQAQTLIAHWRLEAERLEDQPILLYAQKLAETESLASLKAAIQEVNQIPLGRVLHGEAQGLAYAWSQKVEVLEDDPFLAMAQSQARQGLLSEAIETASVIRPGRALYGKAQSAIGDWQAQLYQAERPDRPNYQTSDSQQEAQPTEQRSSFAEPPATEVAPAEQPSLSPAEPLLNLPSQNPSPTRQLPRTIDELMQTHPRPTAERLSPSQFRPTPETTQPLGESAPLIENAPASVEERTQPEAIPTPIAEPVQEPVPAPSVVVEENPPVPVAEPIAEPPSSEFVIEPIEELPPLNEPASVPLEEVLPLSEGWLEQEPLSSEPSLPEEIFPAEVFLPANEPASEFPG